METLSNFSSAYCFISFILGALFMLTMLCIAAMGKVKEPRNRVHFYVPRDKHGTVWLYMGKPVRRLTEFASCSYGKLITDADEFSNYGLSVRDFVNLKWEDEPVEVFINMED